MKLIVGTLPGYLRIGTGAATNPRWLWIQLFYIELQPILLL
jgi:hypothetical protein